MLFGGVSVPWFHHHGLSVVQLLGGRLITACVLWQDDTLAAQAALEKQMSAVGEDVEDTRSKVDEVSRPLSSRAPRCLMQAL